MTIWRHSGLPQRPRSPLGYYIPKIPIENSKVPPTIIPQLHCSSISEVTWYPQKQYCYKSPKYFNIFQLPPVDDGGVGDSSSACIALFLHLCCWFHGFHILVGKSPSPSPTHKEITLTHRLTHTHTHTTEITHTQRHTHTHPNTQTQTHKHKDTNTQTLSLSDITYHPQKTWKRFAKIFFVPFICPRKGQSWDLLTGRWGKLYLAWK